jgi:hypothetical protein
MPMLATLTIPRDQRRAFVRVVKELGFDGVMVIDDEREGVVALELARTLNQGAAKQRATAVIDAARRAAGRPFDAIVETVEWHLLGRVQPQDQ